MLPYPASGEAAKYQSIDLNDNNGFKGFDRTLMLEKK